MNKRILIIGGGFIGKNLSLAFKNSGYRVRLFDKQNIQKDLKKFDQNQEIEYFRGDFLDQYDLDRTLKDADYVYHCLSTTTPNTSNKNIIYDIDSNLKGTINLLQLLKKNKNRYIVFCSSGGTVYGQNKYANEDSPLNPSCSYGVIKISIEKYIIMFSMLYGLKYQILRLSNPYGAFQNYLQGQGVITTLIQKAISGDTFYLFGNKDIKKDYIYIEDLSEIAKNLLEKNIWNTTINVGSGKPTSLEDIINILEKIHNKPITIQNDSQKEHDVQNICLNNSKLLNFLPSTKFTPISEGIRKCYFRMLSE